MTLVFLTKLEVENLLADRTPFRGTVPFRMLGYCKETGNFLLHTSDGVQEASDFLIRKVEGERWYEKYEPK